MKNGTRNGTKKIGQKISDEKWTTNQIKRRTENWTKETRQKIGPKNRMKIGLDKIGQKIGHQTSKIGHWTSNIRYWT